MARLPRLSFPGIPQLIFQRGNNQQSCFFRGEDYLYYMDCLYEAAERYDVLVHAYCLLPNHVHLLMTPNTADGVARVMQMLGRCYVRHFNYIYRRSGSLWEGRYHSSLIEEQPFLINCYYFIEISPVTIGLAGVPEAYPWSSHHANACEEYDRLIIPHEQYLKLGKTRKERASVYRSFFDHPLDANVASMIREAMIGNRVVGYECFKDKIEALTSICVRKQRPGRPRKLQQVR